MRCSSDSVCRLFVQSSPPPSTTALPHRVVLRLGMPRRCLLSLAFLVNLGALFATAVRVSFSPAVVLNIDAYGAIAGNKSIDAVKKNSAAVTAALAAAGTLAGPVTVEISSGKSYWALGGISGSNLHDVTFLVKGALHALPDMKHWPLQDSPGGLEDEDDKEARGVKKGRYKHFLNFQNCYNLTLSGSSTYVYEPERTDMTASPPTSSLIDGQGVPWWNKYVISTQHAKRPKLLSVSTSEKVLIENLTFLNSPSFHILLEDVADVEVRYVHIQVDRSEQRRLKTVLRDRRRRLHGGVEDLSLQPEDLNTDGIDPSGRDVWVHDTTINNDDDSIAVKPCNSVKCTHSDCSKNMLFERMRLTGFGASIGSVSPASPAYCVRNITFRQIQMPGTGKGVYVKSNPDCGRNGGNQSAVIDSILYEDINLTRPLWWAIWIGPQQQHEPGTALGTKCPLDYPISKKCPTQGCVTFNNITLRRIFIDRPLLSPGVVLGNVTNPMTNVVFDQVIVKDGGKWPFDKTYQCKHANVKSIGGTSPVPQC